MSKENISRRECLVGLITLGTTATVFGQIQQQEPKITVPAHPTVHHAVYSAPTNPDRRKVQALGLTVYLDVVSAETGGACAVISFVVPPNGGPPAHIHSREDEIFFVRKGRYQFFMERECFEAGPDTVIYLPKGHIHQYKNVSDETAEHVLTVTPGGLEQSFVDFEKMNLQMPKDFAQMNELSKTKYAMEFFPNYDFGKPACSSK